VAKESFPRRLSDPSRIQKKKKNKLKSSQRRPTDRTGDDDATPPVRVPRPRADGRYLTSPPACGRMEVCPRSAHEFWS